MLPVETEMEDSVLSTIYCDNEILQSLTPLITSPVLIVSSSWEDFLHQAAEEFQFEAKSCSLTTHTGAFVKNFRTLSLLSKREDVKLILKGALKVFQEAPIPVTNAQETSEPKELLSDNGLHDELEVLQQLQSDNNGSIAEQTSSQIPTELSELSNNDEVPSTSRETVVNEISAPVVALDSNNEENVIANPFPIPEIILKMRATMSSKNNTKSGSELIDALKTSPTGPDIKLLRKNATWWLMLNCFEKYYPVRAEYIRLAKSIVHFFPLTGNKHSKIKWDIFYDPSSGLSQLESYARNKRCREGITRRESNPAKKRKIFQQEEIDSEEVKDAEIFMRRTPLCPENKLEMLEKFTITQALRFKLLDDKSKTASQILKRFPLLMEMKEAVDADFNKLKSTNITTFVTNWQRVEKQLFEIGKAELKNPFAKQVLEKIEESMESFDTEETVKLSLQLLLHLLPCQSLGKNKNLKEDKTKEHLCSLMQSFPEGTNPKEAVDQSRSTMKAGLVIIGRNYFVKVEEIIFPLKVNLLEEAIGYIVAYYYVLHMSYPREIKFVMGFFEGLFDIPKTVQSRALNYLLTRLSFGNSS